MQLISIHTLLVLQIISGLQNFDRDNVASVVTAADKVIALVITSCQMVKEDLMLVIYNSFDCYMQGGATHVDIACDSELVKLAVSLTSLPVRYIILICVIL